MGWKPKKGRAGKLKDYIYDILNENIDGISGTSGTNERDGRGNIIPKKKRNTKKSEERCREIVEDIFNSPFPSMRPDFLRNPETGRNLECDLMNQDLKICIERNGEQHYKQVDHFHTKEEDFEKQIQRDKLKEELLSKNGYKLFRIPYTVHYDVLDKYIANMLYKEPSYRTQVERYCDSNKIVLGDIH